MSESKRPSKKSTPTRHAKKLPRSGLAEEILGSGEHSAAEASPPDASTEDPVAAAEPPVPDAQDPQGSQEQTAQDQPLTGEQGDGAVTTPGAAAPPEPEPVAPPSGPQRIFEFADSLEEEQRRDEGERQIRQRLETWVTFELADETFALPVSHVQEILRVNTITHVPHAPHPVRGVTNKRGRVLPVVDLRLRLGLAEAEIGKKSRILVVESRSRLLGLLVDAVQQVVRLDRNAVQPPPPDVMTAQSDYILGVYNLDDTLVILLDVDRVLIISDATSAVAPRKG